MNENGKEVIDSFEKIAEGISKLDKRPGSLCQVYLEGGASLFMNDIKSELKDIDWFIPERWLKYNEISRIKQKGEDIRNSTLIDGFTFNYTHDTKVLSTTEHNGIQFELHCMSPSMIFLIKLDTGRDKDIRDMELICNSVTPESIIAAINSCIKINSHATIMNLASQALSEITCNMLLDSKDITADIAGLIQKLEFNDADKEEIGTSFGIDLATVYKPSNDQWRGTQKRQRVQSFDMNP